MSAVAPSAALAALGAALTWAVGSILFRRALEHGEAHERPSPAGANLFKNSLAALVLAACMLARGEAWPASSSLSTLLASGLFGFALGDSLYFAALGGAGVQRAAMLIELHVPLAALGAWACYGEALSLATLGWSAVVLAGVVLVVQGRGLEHVDERAARRRGLLLAFVAAVAYAVALVLGHRGMEGTALFAGSVVRVIGGIVSALVLAPFAGCLPGGRGARGELAALVRPLCSRRLARLLLPAACLGSVIGLPMFHYALRELTPGVAALLLSTTPLFTLPIEELRGTRHGLRAWIGTLIGFAGVAGMLL